MEDVLDKVEERVLGVLIEKGLTTSDYYPLTLNSLTTGCNQKSIRCACHLAQRRWTPIRTAGGGPGTLPRLCHANPVQPAFNGVSPLGPRLGRGKDAIPLLPVTVFLRSLRRSRFAPFHSRQVRAKAVCCWACRQLGSFRFRQSAAKLSPVPENQADRGSHADRRAG